MLPSFTGFQEFLTSSGIEVNAPEEVPRDPATKTTPPASGDVGRRAPSAQVATIPH